MCYFRSIHENTGDEQGTMCCKPFVSTLSPCTSPSPSPCTWQYSLDAHQLLEERILALCTLNQGEEKNGWSAREMQNYFSFKCEIPEICIGTSKRRIEP